MTTETDSPGKRRLNPFAFPSETDLRFVLLVVAVCMLAVNLSLSLTSLFAPELNPENIFQEDPSYPEFDDPDYFKKVVAGLLKRSEQAFRSLAFPGGLVITILQCFS